MEIQYYPGPFPEAAIAASSTEFAAMADRLAEMAGVGSGQAVFPAGGRGLFALVVRVEVGPVVVTTGEGVLTVNGSPEAVGLFGRNLPAEASLPAGYHVHYEHAGREAFVAAGSVPLVLMVGSAQTPN